MTKFLTAVPFALALLAAPALAAEPAEGVTLGTTPVEIGTALTAENYDMNGFAREDGRIEVTAIKENKRLEISVDPDSGVIQSIESHDRSGPWPRPGLKDAETMASLSAQGYEITRYEHERGKIEVKAVKDGKTWTLKLHPGTGAILSREEEG